MAESPNKDVIYIDIDDEITGIIDKVLSAKHQIVALVLPKRATMLQSVVNMKLLKRTAEEAKKQLVLITGEEGLMPLAGSVGIHVARSLQSKPEIPSGPPAFDTNVEDISEPLDMDGEDDDDKPLDSSKPVGELAGIAAAGAAGGAAVAAHDEDGDTIELDNTAADEPNKPNDSKQSKKDKKAAAAKNKKLKVPNFERFRSWFFLGGVGIIILLVGIYFAATVLPSATIIILTNSQTVNVNEQVTLNTSATSVNPGSQITPAQTAQSQKTYSASVNTTGQQNNGQKATGSVDMTYQDCGQVSQPPTVPSGTGVSANGITFITQQSTTFQFQNGHGGCFNFVSTSSTPVTAQSAGTQSNIQPTSFSVSGESGVSASSAQAMSGGTDDIVQIVAQADINSAQGKINPNNDTIKSQLEGDLQSQGLYPIPATFTASTPNTSNSANVGSPANTVTVTENVSYSMYGAKRSDLQQIIAASVNGQINTSQQKILDYGLDNADFTVVNAGTGSTVVNMQVSALVGSSLDVATIRKQSAGQKPGSAESTIKSYSGVTGVDVKLSPFWVTSIPKNTSKITVKIENPSSK